MAVQTERKSKEERREEILDAAMAVFAERGYHGASTEEIAKRVGISQPYVFRLFGTKKDLYVTVVDRCFAQTLDLFERAAAGTRGEDALRAIGEAYAQLLASNRTYLQAQMQAYAACEDDDIAQAVVFGYGQLVRFVESVSGADPAVLASFFAKGMLMNVIAAMDVAEDATVPWARQLLEGCREPAA
ncbi:MAG TPA: TetR/AcrR family transcriptional regulator [Gaiellaceae bacterium]|nr:TetR/AcrR family transcriptional regulator [Gaiellaceae bacterium]